jgi:hypothetical protein
MITLDITGFYYRHETSPGGISSVLDLMNRAQGVRTKNGGVLSFVSDVDGFVETITVDYDDDSKPTSRQTHDRRLTGRYTYTDSPSNKGNIILVPPGANAGIHVWQYYITDKNGCLKSGADVEGIRTIIPFTISDKPPGGPLKDGDTVTWRLVGIFGLEEELRELEERRDELKELLGDEPTSVKRALRALRTLRKTS